MENNKLIEIILESILRLTPSERVEAVSDLLQIDDALKFQKAIMEICGKKQPATADDKKYKVPKKVLIIQEDMKHVAVAIRGDNRSEPTKWEVLRAAFVRLRYLSKGKGLSRNFSPTP